MPNCTATDLLPGVDADFCTPDLNFGGIDKIYLGNAGQPLTDWTQLTEWNNRLSQTGGIDSILTLHVTGDKPLPENTVLKFSNGRETVTKSTHTVNVSVDETSQKNYNLIKWLEDHVGMNIPIWYASGKYLYGGNEGISANLVLGDVIPETDEELNTFKGTIKWKGKHPERILNPMA